jgi:hypothetical protein
MLLVEEIFMANGSDGTIMQNMVLDVLQRGSGPDSIPLPFLLGAILQIFLRTN